jgi:hypothetical protein
VRRVALAALLFAPAAAASDPLDRCKRPVAFDERRALDVGDGALRVEPPLGEERYFVTLKRSPAQAWATFLPDEWELPPLYAWDAVPLGTHVVRVVGGRGHRIFLACVDAPESAGLQAARGDVMFPLFASVPIGDEALSADLVGERVRFARGHVGSNKWLLVADVGAGEELEFRRVRMRVVRVVAELGRGWVELAQAR